jgi:type IV pilus assembly protein PilY1
VFVVPVVPVSQMNRAYAGNYVYVGFFKPQQSGRWLGNIKKYGLGSSGEILDADGVQATLPDGRIKDNARSYWSSSSDGPNVEAGGAGKVLLDQTSRNLYTYMGTQASLTHTDNQFSTGNALITPGVLNVPGDTERSNLINEVYGGNRSWILGDIIHSQPAVVHYDTNGDGELDSFFIFVGSNDGMLHCFDDSDGSELWGFIPPDQLGRLPLLLDDDHDYFVDGPPVVYEGTSQKILIFGERRGGDHYYALDVTTPNTPSWLYKIEPTILGDEQLGQSWSRPEIHTIKTGSETEDMVFLIAGGYDINQDAATPSAPDSVGRAVFAVDVSDGSLSSLNFNAGNYSDMTHCIVDVSGFDSNGDGYMNRVYAGDLKGQMFAFEDDNGDGTWSSRVLFSASAVDSVQRKILHAPDAVEESFGEIIFLGTGDRADPGETGVENRLYAIKNEWVHSETFTTLTESNLVDVTDDLIQLGTAEQKDLVRGELESRKGWYIRLENQGEKVTSTPTVFAGVVYFTTYTPNQEGGSREDDPCAAPTASGVARLYAVDYLTGTSVYDYSGEVEIDQETGEAAELGKLDRSKVIGTSIPSAPTIAVLESGPKIFTGVEGGVAQEEPVATTDMNIYYWRQFFVF